MGLDALDDAEPLVGEPSVAPPAALSPEAASQDPAPAADPATLADDGTAKDQAPEPPVFDPEAWKNNPAFRSYLNKEQAAEAQRTEARIRAQETERASIAERQRLQQERLDLLAQANAGNLEAQQRLAEDEYSKAVAEQTQMSAFAKLALDADQAVVDLAEGDAVVMARLDFRNFPTMAAWQKACAAHAVEKATKSPSMLEQIQAQAEAIAASKLADNRGYQPNPDTAEISGGAGRGTTLRSQEEWEARYVALKESDPDEARRLRMRMHTPEFQRLPRHAA